MPVTDQARASRRTNEDVRLHTTPDQLLVDLYRAAVEAHVMARTLPASVVDRADLIDLCYTVEHNAHAALLTRLARGAA